MLVKICRWNDCRWNDCRRNDCLPIQQLANPQMFAKDQSRILLNDLLKPFWTPSNINIIICINQTRIRCEGFLGIAMNMKKKKISWLKLIYMFYPIRHITSIMRCQAKIWIMFIWKINNFQFRDAPWYPHQITSILSSISQIWEGPYILIWS